MTTTHNLPQDAHILTALQAACAFGRKQYDERVKYRDYDCSRAIKALNEMRGEPVPVVAVIGGGNSLTGKIKWLLENHGALTRIELAQQIRVELHSVTGICNSLVKNGVVKFDGRGATAKFSLVQEVKA